MPWAVVKGSRGRCDVEGRGGGGSRGSLGAAGTAADGWVGSMGAGPGDWPAPAPGFPVSASCSGLSWCSCLLATGALFSVTSRAEALSDRPLVALPLENRTVSAPSPGRGWMPGRDPGTPNTGPRGGTWVHPAAAWLGCRGAQDARKPRGPEPTSTSLLAPSLSSCLAHAWPVGQETWLLEALSCSSAGGVGVSLAWGWGP